MSQTEPEHWKDLVEPMLTSAVKARASDIHIDSLEGGAGRLRIRVDGALQGAESLAPDRHTAIIDGIKHLAAMDVAQRRLPQDGRIMTRIEGRDVDFRVSTVPSLYGERVVIRVLSRDDVVLDLERLGFPPDDLPVVRRLCHLPNGLILVTGPTGSGKTTLLYAMLQGVDRKARCVMTIEDPVEYAFADIAQLHLDVKAGLTFPRLIRAVLRQDPDVIMVGEIRNFETAQLLFEVSLTGHLVLTTLHTNTAPGALKRLLDMGAEPFLVNSCVAASIAQRLVRVLCPKCRKEVPAPSPAPPGLEKALNRVPDATFYEPVGCEACGSSGYRGRNAIHEILIMGEDVKQAVDASADGAAIRTAARAAGMRTLSEDALEKAAQGITSVSEALRVTAAGVNE